ncbi:protein kinase domain-containing protein [Streptacidiphilus carbonis]|jgi:DivIVA domain-containing protein|uniref:protein kinase domain-containing protein n=1 Tax=Streptacidiphilus carbonis TaxID=105422 RepID=UPI0009FE8DBD|nr:protein kinase [Streptacidiphilus carbonis]
MPLTPEDVSKKQFTTVRLREGYDMKQVDDFLDAVEAELTRLIGEVEDLHANNEDLSTKLKAAQSQARGQLQIREGPKSRDTSPPALIAPLEVHQALGQDDPRRIGRYRLTARLGQGGMGTVYLGRSPGQRLVAVKVVRAEFAADPDFRGRFNREIETSRRVGGFYTAAVVDADAQGDPPWLATEYIPGVSLQEVLRQQGALPVRTVHALALGIAEALEAIHSGGVVHRDLKPGNIIVTSAGPRVIDFGIARAFDGTALTRTNHVIGTPGFLAPEQLTGATVTAAADLYAFGMVLCHAAGAAPFPDGEPLAVALGLLPSWLVSVITRCLDHDPAKRPSPADVLGLLTSNHSPAEDWLPLPVRTMIDMRQAHIDSASS